MDRQKVYFKLPITGYRQSCFGGSENQLARTPNEANDSGDLTDSPTSKW